MSDSYGASANADQALVNQARAGLGPSGFDPSRLTQREYVRLPPDDEDIRLLRDGILPRCPCCMGTPSTFARHFPHSGIYQAYVHCSSCDLQVFKNAHGLIEARLLARTAWSARIAERQAFTAGWRTNAIEEDGENNAYLASCESGDYVEFCHLGLPAYLHSLRDSDQNPQGEDGTASSRSDASAGRETASPETPHREEG